MIFLNCTNGDGDKIHWGENAKWAYRRPAPHRLTLLEPTPPQSRENDSGETKRSAPKLPRWDRLAPVVVETYLVCKLQAYSPRERMRSTRKQGKKRPAFSRACKWVLFALHNVFQNTAIGQYLKTKLGDFIPKKKKSIPSFSRKIRRDCNRGLLFPLGGK